MDRVSHQWAFKSFRARRQFGSLDGLRAIAILAVIWYHGPGQVAALRLLRLGNQGVQLFFAISGFLITTLLLREREETGGISLRQFYARRALRIFPLYYTVLSIYVLLMIIATRESPAFWHNLPYFASYTSNWFVAANAVFGFSWSLATEEQFYCVWPWFEKFFRPKAAVALMAVVIAAALVSGSAWSAGWMNHFLRRIGLSIALPICLGVLLAHVLHTSKGYAWAFRCLAFPGSPVVAMTAAALAIQFRSPALVTATALVLVVASCVVREHHWLRPFLASRPLVQIGKVSYGAYLFHGLVYNAVEIAGSHYALERHGIVEFLITTLCTVAVASASYRYYESFFLRFKERFQPTGSRVAHAAIL